MATSRLETCCPASGQAEVNVSEIRIPKWANGPPGSGNGGYSAALLSGGLPGPVEVRLFVPPPLDQPISLRREGDNMLKAAVGETAVAEARPVTIPDIEFLDPPARDEAAATASRYRGHDRHPFPDCYVCGPRRAEGDGLRLFPGPLAQSAPGPVACLWTPSGRHFDGEGQLSRENIWAALDCPGFFAATSTDEDAVLGRLTVISEGTARASDAPFLVHAWPAGPAREGSRKRSAVTVLYANSGRRIAWSLATWVVVKNFPGAAKRD